MIMSDVKISDEIVEKMGKVGEQIKHCQDTNDRLQKQYDGLDVDAIKRNSEEASVKYEAVQAEIAKIMAEQEKAEKLQKNYEEMLERVKGVESELAKGIIDGKPTERVQKDYTDQITSYLRRGIALSPELTETICRMNVEKSVFGADAVKSELMQKDILVGVGPEAGYFVMPDRASTIIQRIFESSPVRGIANVVATGSYEWEQPLDDGDYECGWVGETESRPVTDSGEVAMVRIPVAEMYAQPRVTQKMLDDAGFDVEGWMNRRVAEKFSRKEANAFVVGDGARKPRGFLDYPAWAVAGEYERFKIETREATGSSGQLDNPDDLIQLQTDLLEPFQAGAVWAMHRKTFSEITTLKSEPQGYYLINTSLLRDGADEILLGKPVVMMADMPEVAVNSKSVAYADFNQFYTIVDRFGIRVLRDVYTDKPFVRLYTTRRVGGGVTNFQAGKILQINA
jgi:HK97 family phage major capsid protein